LALGLPGAARDALDLNRPSFEEGRGRLIDDLVVGKRDASRRGQKIDAQTKHQERDGSSSSLA
jgi:hypothetical protein